ncbi:PREDICTED: macrophage mannose receptor 1-like [Branchiostoma belcheri]|uniref:Macrophage mannose receptor 1-like n=1 Tax=Branchiostoma belcheri TaxID=7741 RepID=A0A6P5AS03_BRABE|nr:PREDICTED: macrophage mannose receptor 1-like [Branchiostoma belcheri]
MAHSELRFRLLVWLFVLFGSLGTITAQESSGLGSCPDGYVQFEGVCYRVYKEFRTYGQAMGICEDDGGTLAMPKTKSIDAFFTGLIIDMGPMTDAWIGLSNIAGTWTWLDGNTVDGCGFSAFDDAITLNTAGHCGYIKFTSWYKWHEDSCDGVLKSGFICQIADMCTDHPDGVSSGDTCYFANSDSYQTYAGARDGCTGAGALLAMPKNPGTTFMMMGIIIKYSASRSTDYWVGIDDLAEDGREEFADGLLLDRCSYTNWIAGFSGNDAEKNCVAFKSSMWMEWSFMDCTRPANYICQLGPGDNDGCILRTFNVVHLFVPTTIPPTTTTPPTTTPATTTAPDPTTPTTAAPVTTPRPETTTVPSTTSTFPRAPTIRTTTAPDAGQQGKQASGVDQGALAGGVSAGVVVLAAVGIGVGVAAYKFKWLAKVSPNDNDK